MQNTVLEVKNLTKKFGNFTAVDNISFSLKKGEILGFLGINGAGKTTTIQMLLGMLEPTSGEVFYYGRPLKGNKSEIMEEVNFSTTYTSLPDRLTVRENLTYISYLYSIKNRKERIEKIVKIFNIENLIDKRMMQLSAGQKTKVNLAKSFLNFPKILLLDEPTASLDVETAKEVRKLLLEERERFNLSMLFTSHNMNEVEEVCDRIIFINQGKIIANDTPRNLAKSIQISHLELVIQQDLEKLEKYCKEKHFNFQNRKHSIIIDIPEKNIAGFLQEIGKEGITYLEISIEKPSLEDYFLQVAGGNNENS